MGGYFKYFYLYGRARRGSGIGFMQHFARRKRYLYWNKGETP